MATGNLYKKFGETWKCAFRVFRQTNTLRDRHAYHNTLHSYRRQSNNPTCSSISAYKQLKLMLSYISTANMTFKLNKTQCSMSICIRKMFFVTVNLSAPQKSIEL